MVEAGVKLWSVGFLLLVLSVTVNNDNIKNDKVRTFLSEVTNGKLNISKGMINGLCKEFSKKTDAEKSEIAGRMMQSPVMNADFTNANINGKKCRQTIRFAKGTPGCISVNSARQWFLEVMIIINTFARILA